jgi:hypothetical protein
VAIVVAEGVQHHGVGRALVEAGVAWARGAGYRRLTATMLVGNVPIYRLLTGLGLRSRTVPLGAGVCRVEIDLAPQSAARTMSTAIANPSTTVMP